MASHPKIAVQHSDWVTNIGYFLDKRGVDVLDELIEKNLIRNGDYKIVVNGKNGRRIISLERSLSDEGVTNKDTLQILSPAPESPLSCVFLGPKAENAKFWREMMMEVFDDYAHWRKNYFPNDPAVVNWKDGVDNGEFFERFRSELSTILSQLKTGFPFHSPRYIGHMLSGQTLPAVMGYFAGMLYNSNNVTDEAAPITVKKELEFGEMICKMIGYSKNSFAHVCSGGTVANIEALWVARHAQFMPLVIKEICIKENWAFGIETPQSSPSKINISEVDNRTLLSLRANESISMVSNLLKYLKYKTDALTKIGLERVQDIIKQGIDTSVYNVKRKGLHNVLTTIGLKPVLLIPESAHYSLKKAASVLGYGEDSIRPIPVDDSFRINIKAFKEIVAGMAKDEYLAAVIVVAGTTEEGAVDPIHEVLWFRREMEKTANVSFWLHVDAAWGGYIRTLFCDEHDVALDVSVSEMDDSDRSNFEKKAYAMIDRVSASESHIELLGNAKPRNIDITWADKEVYKAFMAIHGADSVTIDPHKLGYVPYPAGVIAYKNRGVAQLIAQEAAYISASGSDIAQFEVPEINAVGPYILEGSKPGAAALSCWFSAHMIPLDLNHHGKIVKVTLLGAQKFKRLLQIHKSKTFSTIDNDFVDEKVFDAASEHPFSFELLYDNIDTNVVCFIVVPTKWSIPSKHRMEYAEWSLKDVNKLNRKIYEHFSINPTSSDSERKASISQRFYVSRTELKKGSYAYSSIECILDKYGFNQTDYEEEGLFVMRSTIMNPWYSLAVNGKGTSSGIDYLRQFIKELHFASRKSVDDFVTFGASI